MDLEIVKDKTILVIEPNSDSRIKIKAIFDFIEYGSIVFSDSIEANSLTEDPYFIVVDQIDNENEMLHQLQAIHDKYQGRIPVLVFSDKQLSTSVESLITDTLDFPPTFKKLRIALQNIKMFYLELSSGESRSSILFRSLVGVSPTVSKGRELIEQVADNEASVLILGDSGTGKEVVARNLHYHSDRKDKPFVPINCGAIPPDLLESELFGHEKGAFTGAISSRQGRFELAEKGTLFLDEIGDMSLPMQVKLLRVLQERTFERVGSNKSIVADVRILAATHRNLEANIKDGTFREDLFYRLNVFPIELPSLRERLEDVPFLLQDQIDKLEADERGSVRLTAAATEMLGQYSWPGNVRELSNLVERLSILYPDSIVDVQHLPPKYQSLANARSQKKAQASKPPFNPALMFADFDDEDDLLDESQQNMPEKLPSNLPERITAGLAETAITPDQASSVEMGEEGLDLKEHLANMEINLIKQALSSTGGVVAHAAKLLKMRRTTLVEKLKKYAINNS